MGGLNNNPYVALFQAGFQMDMSANAAKQKGVEGKILGHQFDRQADNAEVEAQQLAKGERKRARLLASRAQAVAGASGAGASDQQITDILGDIDAEGEINALNSLFTGRNRAKDLRYQADVARRTGTAQQIAGQSQGMARAFSAFTDFANDNPTFFSKYGGDRAQSIGTGTAYSDFAGMPDSGERYA